MKKTLLIVLFTISIFSLHSQNSARYTAANKWFMGFNFGGAYQTSDIQATQGYGIGGTLGRTLGKKEHLFNLDLRFRYLHAIMYGSDTKPTLGSDLSNHDLFNGTNGTLLDYNSTQGIIYQNYMTTLNRYSLEGSLVFNRLKQNTGIIFNIFGGLGLSSYNTLTDQLDEEGNQYDYSTLTDPSQTDLSTLRDGTYETRALGNEKAQLKFMPSVGMGIGYQFTPVFSMGIEHKTTFTLNDYIDGYATGSNDLYHYTSLGFIWRLGGERNTTSTTHVPVSTQTESSAIIQGSKPVIIISYPRNLQTNTASQTEAIFATIENVSSAEKIECFQNGVPTTFEFDSQSGEFKTKLNLSSGSNSISINAYNNYGKASVQRTFSYTPEDIKSKTTPPVVEFINPLINQQTSEIESYTVVTRVMNVTSADQIKVFFNDREIKNFKFSSTDQAISIPLKLNMGANTIKVIVTNDAGKNEKQRILIFAPKIIIPKPIVNFIDPLEPTASRAKKENVLRINVQQIEQKSHIRVFIDEKPNYNFTFDQVSSTISLPTSLDYGIHKIRVEAKNESGFASDEVQLTILKPIEKIKAPIIHVTYPTTNPSIQNASQVKIQAKIENIKSINEIQVIQNGISISTFSFQQETNILSINSSLNKDNNNFEIIASNNGGREKASVIITYKPPVIIIPSPEISFISPQNNITVQNESQTFILLVKNVNTKEGITLYVNELRFNAFDYTPETGKIVFTTTINEGINKIVAVAKNQKGQTKSELAITYKPAPCPKPSIQFINTSLISASSNFTLKATIQDVKYTRDIHLTLNGTVIPSEIKTNNNVFQLVAHTVLKEGNNEVLLIAKNNCGTTQKNITITYKPCHTPFAELITKVPEQTQVGVIKLSLKTKYLGQDEISIRNNGKLVSTNFINGQINTEITLIEGNNLISIEAKNKCGDLEMSKTILFQKPCIIPQVFITSHNTQDVESNQQIIKAKITGDADRENIKVLQNGKELPFKFDNQILESNLQLTEGINSIIIEAIAPCGASKKEINLTYTPCKLPKIDFSTPTNVSTEEANYPLNIPIINAISSDVKLMANNKSIAFDFIEHKLQTKILLTEGINPINLTVTNKCGVDQLSFTINKTTCPEPSASWVITNNTVIETSSYQLDATVLNAKKEETKLLLNGTAQDFTLQNLKLTSSLSLKKGNNMISLSVKNSCGAATIDAILTHQLPCKEPMITLIQPSNNITVSEKKVHELSASYLGDVTKENVKLSINNQPISFNASSGKILASLNLDDGENMVVLITKNECGDDQKVFQINYNPCLQPQLSVEEIPAETKEPTYKFSAKIKNVTPSEVLLELNGTKKEFKLSDEVLSSTLNLKEGNNLIKLSIQTACGEGHRQWNMLYTKPCSTPVISINNPTTNPSTSASEQGSLVAKITGTDAKDKITLLQNNSPIEFKFNDNLLQSNFKLNTGANEFLIRISNTCGNIDKTQTIIYEACNAPTLTLITKDQEVNTAAFSINGEINNAQESDITVTVNGKEVPFQYTSNKLNTNVTLTSQDNIIAVTVNNTCGNVQKQLNIKYTEPCLTPTLSAKDLSNQVDQASINIAANIKNAKQSEISLILNGQKQSFQYTTNNLSSQIELKEGNNSILLTVQTPCGKAEKSWTVNYSLPCVEPVLSNINAPSKVQTSQVDISANISNALPQQVSVTLNGKTQNFQLSEDQFGTHLSLKEGNNILLILVKTDCGEQRKELNINYSIPCAEPKITVNSPPKNPWSTPSEVNNLVAKIAGDITSNDIKVTLNGQTLEYKFNGNVLQSVYKLQEGENEIIISATNNCGTDENRLNITYRTVGNQSEENKGNGQNENKSKTEETKQDKPNK